MMCNVGIKEMETVRCQFIPTGMVRIEKWKVVSADKEAGAGGNVTSTTTVENSSVAPQKV